MKKQLIRVICLCLALVVTMGSVGMAATEQICQMAGLKKMPAAAMPDKCCAKKKTESPVNTKIKLDKKCCSVHTKHHKLETPAAEKPFSVKVPVLLPVIDEAAFLWDVIIPGDTVPALDNNKSPPLFGTDLLKTLHEFRV